MDWSLYMVRCADGSLYTGISNDVEARFQQHQSQGPRCAKYLRGKGPIELAFSVAVGSRAEASRAEYWVKRLSKTEKEALSSGASTLEDVL